MASSWPCTTTQERASATAMRAARTRPGSGDLMVPGREPVITNSPELSL